MHVRKLSPDTDLVPLTARHAGNEPRPRTLQVVIGHSALDRAHERNVERAPSTSICRSGEIEHLERSLPAGIVIVRRGRCQFEHFDLPPTVCAVRAFAIGEAG